jgi:macrodomain Ter protein organizer (MatP/YcbG family)
MITELQNSEEQDRLRKLIDIPYAVLNDLKMLASNSHVPLKVYIQDLLASEVEKKKQQNEQ